MRFSAEQLALDLPHLVEFGRAAFLPGPSNANALALIDRWPQWPGNAAVIWGPEGTGKSHLCDIWRARSGARTVDARDLVSEDLPTAFGTGGLAVEAIDTDGVQQTLLFHALNLARGGQGFLLMTARRNPAAVGFDLPDLASRLRSLPAAELKEPDDPLLRRVLTKLFADRQLQVDPDLIEFLAQRMERSLAAAMGVVAALDRASLVEARPITRRFAARVLGPHFAADAAAGQGDLFGGE